MSLILCLLKYTFAGFLTDIKVSYVLYIPLKFIGDAGSRGYKPLDSSFLTAQGFWVPKPMEQWSLGLDIFVP